MIRVGEYQKDINYQERRSSYGIILNELGQIAVIYRENCGLIFSWW